jgi:hypothetical protein
MAPDFASFNDDLFDEDRFEQRLEGDPQLALPTCWYWIRKLQARFYAGDYASAVEADVKTKGLLRTTTSLQAVSGEIVLDRLIDTLMVMAVEHAGAERGLLILPRGDEQLIEAEATTRRDTLTVRLLATLATPSELPDSVLRYVLRTQDSVILDDASVENMFSTDE